MGQRNHWCSGVHSWTGDSPQRPQAWKRLGMMQSGILVFALYFKTITVKHIIICGKFFFLFICREPTTWPANNCLQIMVCSWAIKMSSNLVWLQILIFCSCVNETTLFSFLRSLLLENGRSLPFPKKKNQTRWSSDKTIISSRKSVMD